MKNVFCHEHRVEFVETDGAGIVHFSRYALWVEAAEAAFWRARGGAVAVVEKEKLVGWPKLNFSISYRRPACFGDVVVVSLVALKTAKSTLTWTFKIARDKQLLAEGEMVVVHAATTPLTGKLEVLSLPEEL